MQNIYNVVVEFLGILANGRVVETFSQTNGWRRWETVLELSALIGIPGFVRRGQLMAQTTEIIKVKDGVILFTLREHDYLSTEWLNIDGNHRVEDGIVQDTVTGQMKRDGKIIYFSSKVRRHPNGLTTIEIEEKVGGKVTNTSLKAQGTKVLRHRVTTRTTESAGTWVETTEEVVAEDGVRLHVKTTDRSVNGKIISHFFRQEKDGQLAVLMTYVERHDEEVTETSTYQNGMMTGWEMVVQKPIAGGTFSENDVKEFMEGVLAKRVVTTRREYHSGGHASEVQTYRYVDGKLVKFEKSKDSLEIEVY